jgi:hypothetical protein
MTILSNSWAQQLKNLAGINKANLNMKAFTHALAPTTTLDHRINALTKEIDAVILLAGPNHMILQTHSWAKFGGTQLQLTLSIFCLVGMGSWAFPVIINHTHAIASATITTPLGRKITTCTIIQELQNLARTVAATTDYTTVLKNWNQGNRSQRDNQHHSYVHKISG